MISISIVVSIMLLVLLVYVSIKFSVRREINKKGYVFERLVVLLVYVLVLLC